MPDEYDESIRQPVTHSTDKALPIYYEWRAWRPAGPWYKTAGWKKLPHRMTWSEAKQWAVANGLSFESQMECDESSAEFRSETQGTPKPPTKP